MNKAIITLAILTAGFTYATFFIVFSEDTPSGYVNKMAASAIGSIEGLFTELPPPVQAIARERAEPIATTTHPSPEAMEGTAEEDEIDVSSWKIFYTPTNFDGAGAYTLRYPDGWVMNDTDPRVNILMHEVDGFVYSLSFYQENINLESRGRFGNATTTTLGEADYTRKEAVQAGTTTLVAYTPQTVPRSFRVAFGTVPPARSWEFVKLYERILSTLAVEPATYAFKIQNVRVNKSSLNMTTNTAIAEPAVLSWSIKKNKSFKNGKHVIDTWIENKRGKRLTTLGEINAGASKQVEFTLPPLCSSSIKPDIENCIKKSDITFGKQYRVVMVGEESNKAYSNWFIIYDDIQFTEQELSIAPKSGALPLTVSLEASVKGSANANDRYIIFFESGEYVELSDVGQYKFKGKWTRTYSAPELAGTVQRVYLMRTTKRALEHRLYGASTLEAAQTYADLILKREIKLLK